MERFFGIDVERSCIKKLPAIFRYDNRRWDYAISADNDKAEEIAMKFKSTGYFRVDQIPENGVWILKETRH